MFSIFNCYSKKIEGTLFLINSNYAPEYSYIFPAYVIKKNQSKIIPCTMQSNGEVYMKCNFDIGDVIIIDTNYTKKQTLVR